MHQNSPILLQHHRPATLAGIKMLYSPCKRRLTCSFAAAESPAQTEFGVREEWPVFHRTVSGTVFNCHFHASAHGWGSVCAQKASDWQLVGTDSTTADKVAAYAPLLTARPSSFFMADHITVLCVCPVCPPRSQPATVPPPYLTPYRWGPRPVIPEPL
ncbi:hypothetical protein PWT90_10688 [Aphanocladium album]|nr:hypothetical protein PWT90_10688 [Aphanocladium album]